MFCCSHFSFFSPPVPTLRRAGSQPIVLGTAGTFTLSHIYAQEGTFTVQVVVRDDDGGEGSADSAVEVVLNTPPQLGRVDGGTVDEGSIFHGVVSFSDPDPEGLTITLDYGDGSPVEQVTPGSARTIDISHPYPRSGSYLLTVTVDDGRGTATGSSSIQVTNVAPQLSELAGATLFLGEVYTADGSFVDPGEDSWTGTVSYGSGSASLPLSGWNFSLSHGFAGPGIAQVEVVITDSDGAAGSASATVEVLDAAGAIRAVAAAGADLVRSGDLSNRDARKLERSLDKLARNLGARQSARSPSGARKDWPRGKESDPEESGR